MRLLPINVAAASIVCAANACAHSGGGHGYDFIHGITHPISGVDHLAAMVAVGLWASQLGGRALWLLPVTFVLAMSVGAIAIAGLGVAFAQEAAIVASVVLLGVLVTFRVQAPVGVAAAIVALFATGHGLAHWAEAPLGANRFDYATGFVATTAGLHLLGVVLGQRLARDFQARAVQGIGAAVTLAGLALMTA